MLLPFFLIFLNISPSHPSHHGLQQLCLSKALPKTTLTIIRPEPKMTLYVLITERSNLLLSVVLDGPVRALT